MLLGEGGEGGQSGALGVGFTGLVEVGVGDVVFGEGEQGALQDAPRLHPCADVVARAGNQ